MDYAAAILAGYLLGSIPVALLVARAYGVDLRRTGDGNPGAWNAFEQLGGRRAAPAFIGDGAKGLVAGLVGLALGEVWMAYVAVAAAMVGHMLPVFAGLRGGMAVMTFVGGGLVLSPPAALLALIVCGAVTAASSFTYGARIGVFAFPGLQLAFDPVEQVAATGALMALIGARFMLRSVLWRARDSSARARSAPGATPRA